MKKYVVFFLVVASACAGLGYLAGKDRMLDPMPEAEALAPEEGESGPAAAPAAEPPAPKAGKGLENPVEARKPAAQAGPAETEILIDTAAAEPAPESARPRAAVPAGIEEFVKTHARTYVVRHGDNLSRIGLANKVPFELLMRINGKKTPDLAVGERMLVVEGPFRAVVDVSDRIVRLMRGEICLKSYPAAVGPGDSTPRGRFTVQSKIRNPDWTNPETRSIVPFGSPENPLGTRWIAFTTGYGIHGTNDPSSIGTATSKGCIRMQNADAEELFDFLKYGDSTVDVTD